MSRPIPRKHWRRTGLIAGALLLSASLAASAELEPGRSRLDPALQGALERADRGLRVRLGIAGEERACGVLDVSSGRLAWIRPDALFYGASVPKIGILLGYFETHPEAATRAPPQVERELQLMIKRSSNELAAKYSQLVGLETIQRILRSERYRLYDDAHGGGLWCGKHYGLAEPRRGDPVGGYSHAATVRQCLRFYQLLEHGRLVSPAASRTMRRIFEAPGLEFHDASFVAGLKGRDVTLIRKNGLWEDWHLDTARVRHGDRIYLLAGMAHHPRGREYLAGLASAVDEILCGEPRPRPLPRELVIHEGPLSLRREHGSLEHTSAVLAATHPFNDALLSWNVDLPRGLGFTAELRVGRSFDDSWSPYLHVGEWGVLPEGHPRIVASPLGRIDVDYFRSEERLDRIQYRLRVVGDGTAGATRVARVGVCLSDTTGLPHSLRPAGDPAPAVSPGRWSRRLPVPFRSQQVEPPDLRGKICSPTSVAMVLSYRGVERPTLEVAARVFDPIHDIYGNWPRAVQGAYTFGVPGYLTRFSDWLEVRRMVAEGQPIIASIRARKGELSGAPYPSTEGHLLVIVGFDGEDRVLVNDPAARTSKEGQRAYSLQEMDQVWLRHGGTAYILEAPRR